MNNCSDYYKFMLLYLTRVVCYYDKMIDDKKKTISFLKEYLEGC